MIKGQKTHFNLSIVIRMNDGGLRLSRHVLKEVGKCQPYEALTPE